MAEHSLEGELESKMMPAQEVCRIVGKEFQDLGKQVSGLQNLNTNDKLVIKVSDVTFLEEFSKSSNGSTAFRGSHRGHPVALIKIPEGHVKIDSEVVLTEKQPHVVLTEKQPHIIYDQGSIVVLKELRLYSLNRIIYSFDRLSSWMLVKIMRDMALALERLHALNIVHGNLRPENILIVESGILSAKLSDDGLMKCLHGHRASQAPGLLNPEWQAPELSYPNRHPTHQTDLFSLGCMFFSCLKRVTHPYGPLLERGQNFHQNIKIKIKPESLSNYEGYDLVQTLLKDNSYERGTASKVVMHPLFWCPLSRMEFFCHLSDKAKEILKVLRAQKLKEDRAQQKGRKRKRNRAQQLKEERAQLLKGDNPNSNFLRALEDKCQLICGGNWKNCMNDVLVENLKGKGNFMEDSLVDLLRAIRNMWVHRCQLSQDVQELFNSIPMGCQKYFTDTFPALLMETYLVVAKHYCSHEPFVKYFERNASSSSQLWNMDRVELGTTLFSANDSGFFPNWRCRAPLTPPTCRPSSHRPQPRRH